jgi:cytochrome c553
MKLISIPLFASLILASSSFAADAEKGKASFNTLCLSCHGATGMGDGPVGAALPADQKPRNLQDPKSYKYAKDDAKLAEIIRKGGAAVGLSMMMPAQPSLSDTDIADLIAYIKTLQK